MRQCQQYNTITIIHSLKYIDRSLAKFIANVQVSEQTKTSKLIYSNTAIYACRSIDTTAYRSYTAMSVHS